MRPKRSQILSISCVLLYPQASAAVGTVEYRTLTEPVRSANPMIDDFILGHAVDVDIDRQVVIVKEEQLVDEGVHQDESTQIIEVPYDKLVVSIGCKVADNWVPGSKDHCLRLKTIDDAKRIRNAINKCLEFASRPEVADSNDLNQQEREKRQKERRRRTTFAIIGGGPTGLELAGELSDFVEDIAGPGGAYGHLKNDIHIVLLEGMNALVPQFEPSLRQHALANLCERGVKVHLDTKVVQVGPDFIKHTPMTGGGDETTLETGLNIWAAGTGPLPFTTKLMEKLPEQTRGRGKVIVDQWMRCETKDPSKFGTIIVMGDAAAFEARSGSYLPQTAQVAGQQGAYIARLLDRGYDLSVTPPQLNNGTGEIDAMSMWLKMRGLETAPGFDFLNLGALAYEGGGKSLAQVSLGDVPLASFVGGIGFVLWRIVYLAKQISMRNR